MDVTQAITEFEAARVAMNIAGEDAGTKNAAFLAAQSAKVDADTAVVNTRNAFNTAVDVLIEALKAVKIPVVVPDPVAVGLRK